MDRRMQELYHGVCRKVSRVVTRSYSTSFSLGIRVFHKRFRDPIYAVYGFVRFADETVDTFHDHPKSELLAQFRRETYRAIERGFSLNPILHSFQEVVRQYDIERVHIDAFFDSMEMDLRYDKYQREIYEKYVYGSAEVVGLMCLKVFTEGDTALYQELKEPAKRLGAAFQKVNFLRDMKSDYMHRGRVYFPQVEFEDFDNEMKARVEAEIKEDFRAALSGIHALPRGSRIGVYLAYVFYNSLFHKIRKTDARVVREKRIRISNMKKLYLMCTTVLKDRMRWV